MFSRPKILFPVSLLFVALLNPKFNPYLLFKFLIFYHCSIICMECGIFARLEIHLTIRFSRKNQLKRIGTAIIMLYICLTKRNVDYFDL